jgi:hypothetical protein
LELDIEAYCQALDAQDECEREAAPVLDAERALPEKLEKLKARQARQRAQLDRLEASGETQLSGTDPDARALRKTGQSTVGYNVQNVVDAKHKLIVHHDVTNAGNDAEQLAPQALAAKEALGVDRLVADADAGYYSEAQLAECARADIEVYVPIPDKHGAVAAEGRFSGVQFHSAAGGEVLTPQGKPNPICGVRRTRYTRPATACQGCLLAVVCLPEKTRQRQIYRSEHAETVEAHRRRMAEAGTERMRQRAGLAEHPFGTLKRRFGWDHFLVRGFEKVRGEMGLAALGYNLTWVLNILGLRAFRDYCARRLRDHRAATEAAIAA